MDEAVTSGKILKRDLSDNQRLHGSTSSL